MVTRLILVRHGETLWNAQKRYCGSTDIGLSAKGKKQARRLKEKLNGMSINKVYTSGKKRAIQTSRIIFNGAKIIKVEALREINFGALEGLTHKEIMKKYTAVYEKWLKDPFKNHITYAEQMNVFKKRVQTAIGKISRFNRGKTIAIVCHGGVVGVFVSGLLKSRNFWRCIPSSASITIVEYKKGAPRIILFNDTAHLR